MADARFAGEWTLVPELCLYQAGEPPARGLYRIEAALEGFAVSISWETATGERHSVAFGGPADGRPIPSEAPGVSHITLTQVDEATLDSAAFDGDRRLAWARRRASQAGDLLTTVQETIGPDGSATRNFQVYRRRGA